jgi:hypothetical protein
MHAAMKEMFSPLELKRMQEQIVDKAAKSLFMVEQVGTDDDGSNYVFHTLEPAMAGIVRKEAEKFMKEHIKKLLDDSVKPRVEEVVKIATDRIGEQLVEVVNKISLRWDYLK